MVNRNPRPNTLLAEEILRPASLKKRQALFDNGSLWPWHSHGAGLSWPGESVGPTSSRTGAAALGCSLQLSGLAEQNARPQAPLAEPCLARARVLLQSHATQHP